MHIHLVVFVSEFVIQDLLYRGVCVCVRTSVGERVVHQNFPTLAYYIFIIVIIKFLGVNKGKLRLPDGVFPALES